MEDKIYIALDLKSFYASVECTERQLNPLTTNLVVADISRTKKTICLAVSPALKSYGIGGRARLFEVIQTINAANAERRLHAPNQTFTGTSYDSAELHLAPWLAIDYIIAPPQMAHYIEVSASIYQIYLKYVAPEDIHVYSIDEVFIDATKYLKLYDVSPQELAMRMILDVLHTTGITATAGIGTNLYLSKVAMDIEAKHIPADQNGVRIATLDEKSYRQKLWTHQPLTDFWRVGRGYAKTLAQHGLYTMGDIARCSIGKPSDYYNEALLYRLFGVNAELLIDHAWGWEPCTIADIKAYKPAFNSIGAGQVLQSPYTYEKAMLVLQEMTDALALDLVSRGLVTNQLTLTVGYDIENLTDPQRKKSYKGPIKTDYYGRSVPKHAHGTEHLPHFSSSTKELLSAATTLFSRIVDAKLLIRRLNITANHVILENAIPASAAYEQLDLFTDDAERENQQAKAQAERTREKQMQNAVLSIRKKYGKNAILKGMSLQDGATAKLRNNQIGGHKA